MNPQGEVLDATLRCSAALEFETKLQARLIGQPRAVEPASRMVQTFMAGFNSMDRPAGSLLLLGPTGVGKTRLVEAIAEILFGNRRAFYKVACADYGDSHQTNRLLGAPPGYIGYAEHKGDGLISQEKLDQFQTPDLKLNLCLFDEIEKASDRLFDVMLNLLDKGNITLSNGSVVDFSQTLVVLTSNLGATKLNKAIGFTTDREAHASKCNAQAVLDAVKHRFKPEFLNRIDEQVMFGHLTPDHLRQILALEIDEIRRRLQKANNPNKFVFALTRAAEDALVERGFDKALGARPLKRTLERHIVHPLANMTMSGQLQFGDYVIIHYEHGAFDYRRYNGDEIARMPDLEWGAFRSALVQAVGEDTIAAA